MDTPIPEFLAEAANRRVSDIFIIAGRPLAEKIDGHLLDRGDRLMPDQTENLLRTIYGLAENRDISRLMETGDDDFSFSIPGVSRFRVNAYKQRGSLAAVIRVIAFRLPDPAELSIPEDVMNISEYTRGMVLVTGSAGSGKFLEIMANRLGVTLQELFDMADKGTVLPISSLCTVFAESEVINYIGEGQKREDIAAGVVDSVANKVAQLAMKKNLPEKVILTGGLSNSTYFTKILSQKLGQTVSPTEHGRYAGALGAALLAKEKKKR